METIGYLHLASSNEASQSIEVVPVRVSSQFFTNLNWKKISLSAAMRFLSVALTMAVFSIAGQALALERGSSGSQVRNVQKCLQKLGYFNGPVNGNYGPLTEEAVKKFQRAKGISAIGKVGPQTERSLQAACQSKQSGGSSSNVLKVGSRGSAVSSLQQNLQRLGYYNGPITGYFGQETQQAVTRFQQSYGLQADGIAGGRTTDAIRVSLRQNNGVGGDNLPNGLNEGDVGSEVTQLQRDLRQLGYFRANPTGSFGPLTRDAVINFQRDRGLIPNGIADTQTLATISRALATASPANTGNSGCSVTSGYICLGESSPRVLAVQQRLQERGFFRGDTSGYYGPATRDAVAQFQRYVGLSGTGFVDFQTWQALGLTNLGTPVGRSPVSQSQYVVVVPIQGNDTLSRVRQFIPNATQAKSKLGNYVNAGAFRDRSEAERLSKALRDRGLDARVQYFN